MHKNCPNEQFLEFLLADIAAEAAWELSLRLGVIASLGSYRFAWKLCGFAAKLKGQ
jgi:hypothetical protein